MIEVSDFKRGLCLLYKNSPCMIVDVSFSTPTARGASVIAKTRLRNLLTGQLMSDSMRSGTSFEPVDVEQHEANYLYSDGSRWYFMDGVTFEQFDLGESDLGDATGYLLDGIEGLRAQIIDDKVVGILMPNTVDLVVTETDPVIKGATAKAQLKRAVLETGLEIQVPAYLTAGETVRVDTRDGHFVERVRS